MSATNLGNAFVGYNYGFDETSADFSTVYAGIISPGIYNGGTIASFVGNNIILDAYTAAYKTSTNRLYTVRTDTSINISTEVLIGGIALGVIASDAPYIVASYAESRTSETFPDYRFKAAPAINDIVFGKAIFTLADVTSIDYSEATYPPTYNPINQDYNIHGTITGIRHPKEYDEDVTFSQFKGDADIYFTCTADRACDITAGSNLLGNEVTIYNSASGDYTLAITYASGKIITLTREKFVTFKCNGTKWTIKKRSIIGQTAQVDFLESNMLQKNGAILNRSDYPALWHHISTNLSPVSDATWLAGNVGNYSTGDGSTTFRMQDTRGLHPRFAGTNSVMKLANTVAYFNGGNVRSVRNDMLQGHRFLTNNIPNIASVGAYAIGGNGYLFDGVFTSHSNFAYTITTDGTNGTPRTGGETAPASVSYYDIVYFEE